MAAIVTISSGHAGQGSEIVISYAGRSSPKKASSRFTRRLRAPRLAVAGSGPIGRARRGWLRPPPVSFLGNSTSPASRASTALRRVLYPSMPDRHASKQPWATARSSRRRASHRGHHLPALGWMRRRVVRAAFTDALVSAARSVTDPVRQRPVPPPSRALSVRTRALPGRRWREVRLRHRRGRASTGR